jgi:antitoxin CcdA
MPIAKAASKRQGGRRPTNVTLPPSLVNEAKRLGVNVSQTCEAGLLDRVAVARRQRWLVENHDAMDAYNARIERDGLTLARYRRF